MTSIIRTLKAFSPRNIYLISNRKVHSHQRIFSGIQPTGAPHLGNYFGAIKRWVALQNEGKDCIFSIVDLHSITVPQDSAQLRNNIYLMTACLLACGIDPDKCIFYLQSQVPQHAELAWILGCLTTMARLSHLPQFKEKSENLDHVPVGLFTYPVLQSADILLYKATHVPVGEDQVQHIQLCQQLAKSFNNKYRRTFPVPEAFIDPDCARIKSLRNPEKKMSKSDRDFKNRIDLTDSPDIVIKRVRQAMTDFTSAVTYDPVNRPGVSNLLLIHSLCTGKSPEDICRESGGIDTGQYKGVVAEAVVEYLKPIRLKVQDYLQDPSFLSLVLKRGAEKAADIAHKTIEEVKDAVGILPLGTFGNSVKLKI